MEISSYSFRSDLTCDKNHTAIHEAPTRMVSWGGGNTKGIKIKSVLLSTLRDLVPYQTPVKSSGNPNSCD